MEDSLFKKCEKLYLDLFEVDEEGTPLKLDSLTITDFLFAISEVTGSDFYLLVDSVEIDDLETVKAFEHKFSSLDIPE